jgi:glycosyltransferase involved in cell wall biosynthesis
MKDDLSVSVIIPSFNQGAFLNDALKSVLDQTFKNYEVIIVDDASDDGLSTDIALSLASENVRVFINPKNIGVCGSRNLAIRNARGKYILPLDADDKIAPTYLEKAVASIESGIADVIYCKARLFGAKCKDWTLPHFSSYNILFGNLVFNCALFRKKDWAEVGGYSEVFVNGYEDWDFWLSFLERQKTFYKIEEPLFFYRRHGTSRNASAKNSHNSLAKLIFEKHRDLYSSYGILNAPTEEDLKKLSVKKSRSSFSPCLALRKGKILAEKIFSKLEISLHYYNVSDVPNFGDTLNIPLIEKLSDKSVRYASSKHADYLCIGSLLDMFLLKRDSLPRLERPLHVWGSGFIAPEGQHPVLGRSYDEQFSREMIFHAVRGFVTLNRLKRMGCDVQETAVGDPGLLAPYVFSIEKPLKKYKIGLIPHYADASEPIFKHLLSRFNDITILNIFDPPETFLAKISECEVIFSSALHGIIASDSLGIPNIWLRISDNLTGGDYKFWDYYSAYSLAPRYIGLAEAMTLTNADIGRIIDEYPIRQEAVSKIQQQLLAACPWVGKK